MLTVNSNKSGLDKYFVMEDLIIGDEYYGEDSGSKLGMYDFSMKDDSVYDPNVDIHSKEFEMDFLNYCLKK